MTVVNQNFKLRDFFGHPISERDVIMEVIQGRFRAGRVLKINKKSITVTCNRTQYGGIVYQSTNTTEQILEQVKDHGAQRNLRTYEWNDGVQRHLINLTALNVVQDEDTENR
jgi:hypothetical protein